MKKYAIIIAILILGGLLLAVQFFSQDQRLDKNSFIESTESIRNLQALDKGLLLLVYQSRYNSEFDNDELIDTNEQISEELNNLKFEALYTSLEKSPKLRKSLSNFEEHYKTKRAILDNYVDSNIDISNALINISILTYQLTDESNTGANATFQSITFQALISKINALFYDLVIGEELQSQVLITDRDQFIELSKEVSFLNPEKAQQHVNQLVTDINTILSKNERATEQFNTLGSLKTALLLNDIQDKYTNYHNQVLNQSNKFNNALIAYGALLFLALMLFAWQIRKNFLYMGQQVAEQTQEIKGAYEDLKESQEQLIQSEKMASLGQMVAGVAHEINTPLGYVTSNIDTLQSNFNDLESLVLTLGETTNEVRKENRDSKAISQKLSATIKSYEELEADILVEENKQLLSDGAYGLDEISKLVNSLKDFARLDRQNTEQIDIHTCLDSSVIIASNHIKHNNVTLIKEFNTEIPNISCFPSKLNQLFLNIITNACQSMKEKGGTLEIRTIKYDDKMKIRFRDEGCGMSDETKQKMFDPFYTTKEIGEGTGLGLSIAYKIIDAHGGNINVESVQDEGTTIDICLPYENDKQ